MVHHLFDLLRGELILHGYWVVAIALLLENAGLPVPGETILLLASFLAFSEHDLSLGWIIITGIVAATTGDNLGFTLGHRGGRPLLARYQHLFRIPDAVILRGERLLQRYGPPLIFVARFIFGLRVIAGPLAGVLGMNWARFALYNFLGATVWVTVIACLGYFFGSQWPLLLRIVRRIDTAVVIVVLAVAFFLWHRHKRAHERSE